jgi:hypothetical protein
MMINAKCLKSLELFCIPIEQKIGPHNLALFRTRLFKKPSLYQNKVVKLKQLLPLTTCIFILALSGGCSKPLSLKIGDQDIFAFGSQDSCNFVLSAQGARVSWKSSVPVHFIITSSVPAEFEESIKIAANTLNSMKRMTLIEVHRDNSYPTSAANDGTNGIYWLDTWDADMPKEQGRTAVKWDISKIRDADIKINAKNFKFFKSGDTDSAGKINVESLLLHEFGHALGLKHIDDTKSMMQPYLAAGFDRNLAGDVDINSLNCEY